MSDKFLSYLASNFINFQVSTLYLGSALFDRSALISWNQRKMHHKVVRLAGELGHIDSSIVYSNFEVPFGNAYHIRSGIRSIIYATAKPLRLASLTSLIGAGISALYSLYVLFSRITNKTVSGWSSTNLQISVLFLFTLMVLALLSEYTYQIVAGVSEQTAYRIIREEKSNNFSFKNEPDLHNL